MLNKIILIGRLTADPDLRYTPSESIPVAQFTLAVDRRFKSGGEKETDFIRIVTWRKQAENCANYLSKGSKAAVEGRLQIRAYEDRDGIKRTIAEVVASGVTFLDSRKDREQGQEGGRQGGGDVRDEDVPF